MHFRIGEKAAAQFGWPLHSIDDCGHGPHIERPDAFIGALGAAMARPS
jgi:pimeloyl-ACP methyl ester carboxylesterase